MDRNKMTLDKMELITPDIEGKLANMCIDFFKKGYEQAINNASLFLHCVLSFDKYSSQVVANYSTKEDFINSFKEILQKAIEKVEVKKD